MRILALLPLLILLLFIVGSLAALLGQLEVTTLGTLLRDAEIRFAFGLSLATALLSLLLACVIALPAAWALVRLDLPGKRWINLLLDLPMVTPPLVTGIGLLLLLGQQGMVGSWWPALAQRLFSPLGIVIAQTYVASAILLRSASAALAAIDRAWLETAHNLGLAPLYLSAGGDPVSVARLGEWGGTGVVAGAGGVRRDLDVGGRDADEDRDATDRGVSQHCRWRFLRRRRLCVIADRAGVFAAVVAAWDTSPRRGGTTCCMLKGYSAPFCARSA